MTKVSQEEFFDGLGFEKIHMVYQWGEADCFKAPNNNGYFRMDHFSDVYVIEWAADENEAKKNWFEDGDLFDDWLPKEELIKQVQDDIKRDLD